MSQRAASLARSIDGSDGVRDFYDHFPYPPPVDNLEKYKQRWQDHERRRADFHLFWQYRPYREDQSILVAGCGTSQAAKHAMRWPAARVTGIDISATSVRHTEQLRKKYDLRNLQIHELAIERVSDLRMTFDQIVCTGVLHHLVDPDAGLCALREVLKPQGTMQLMVYAPYGRAGVYMLQEFCRRVGIRAADGGIRDLFELLRSLSGEHPLQNLLAQAPDFQNEAAIADSLLHPRDRSYSVSQLFDFIENGGLTFGRWVRQAPYSVQCGAAAKLPQPNRMKRLSLKEQYAAVELFRGTMVRHSFIAHCNDGEVVKQQSGITGDTWPAYVPIRMPDTVCIHDRLPPGATAVLINTAHTYRDLFLPITSTEKVWFDAIDGVRSIAEIVEGSASLSHKANNLTAARAFFERMWWYDQVVFDSSQATAVSTGPPT